MNKPKVHKIFKRVICFFLIFIFAFTALSMISSVVIFGVLFHRVDSLDGYVEITYDLAQPAQRREQISFESGGNTLSGYLYSARDPKGLVIIAPGMNSDSDAHLAEIIFFADNGYRCLAYDATGVCKSEGGSTVGLQQSKRDLLAAIDYAKSEPALKDLPIYLYGHSLGGYAVAAALDDAEVEAAVCLSGFNSPVRTMHDKAKEYIGALADIEYPFLYLQNIFTFGGDADETAVESINSVDTPILICHGSGDKILPYEISICAREDEITNGNASFMEIDDPYRGGHMNMWLSGESAKYRAELQDELSDLSAVYGGDIPKEVIDDFYSGVDAEKAMRLDSDFMNKVLAFMEKS